jgi:hypothetical protein
MKKYRFTSLLVLGVVLAAGAIAQGCAPKAHSESLESQMPKRFEIVYEQILKTTGNDSYGYDQFIVVRDTLSKQEFLLVQNLKSGVPISITPLTSYGTK